MAISLYNAIEAFRFAIAREFQLCHHARWHDDAISLFGFR
jgi:hypothetical protein